MYLILIFIQVFIFIFKPTLVFATFVVNGVRKWDRANASQNNTLTFAALGCQKYSRELK